MYDKVTFVVNFVSPLSLNLFILYVHVKGNPAVYPSIFFANEKYS